VYAGLASIGAGVGAFLWLIRNRKEKGNTENKV
jgi:hypothetical protein